MKPEPAIRVSHPRRNTLHGSSQQQGGEIHAQSSPDQGNPSLDHAKTGQRPTDGDRQFLGPVARQLDAVHSPQLHHHLGIHRSVPSRSTPGNGVAATTPALIQV